MLLVNDCAMGQAGAILAVLSQITGPEPAFFARQSSIQGAILAPVQGNKGPAPCIYRCNQRKKRGFSGCIDCCIIVALQKYFFLYLIFIIQ
jgi:hypothetical protein